MTTYFTKIIQFPIVMKKRHDLHKDLIAVEDSIHNSFKTELKRGSSKTVGQALENVWLDFETSLVGSDKDHIGRRVNVLKRATHNLCLEEKSDTPLNDYLDAVDGYN